MSDKDVSDTHPDYPLFPLASVVFPGGVTSLRIFEPRYLDLVRICTQARTGFGICPLERGSETARSTAPRPIGTLVEIVDFDQLHDGFLGITVEGQRRFQIHELHQNDNGLWWGSTSFLDEPPEVACPDEFAHLKQVAETLLERFGAPYSSQERAQNLDSANWLSARLTELLPFDPSIKQELLTSNDPLERLRRIQPLVRMASSK